MSDLIKRNDALEAIKIAELGQEYDEVENVPSVDAVPVRHGKWKPFDLTYGRSIYSCSVCEQTTEVQMCMEKPMYAYCPNCGARMDGERREG